ncbi:MAG TPA: GNAT family N-acetyltransferase [Chthonomonadaceae bacterium]|nr:GNAT family N-acetyltransferase [Chthonomonadaceae bacterium]
MVRDEIIETPGGSIQLRQAEPEDLEAILAVFDATLAWMNALGNVKQWGVTPFSQLPQMVTRFRRHLEEDTVFVAVKAGEIVGAIVVTFAPPPYCWQGAEEPAAYIEPFATAPSLRGAKVGHLLLQKAAQYALQQGRQRLRLDCFAENPVLPAYYEGAGFAPRGEFAVGDWHGRMFERLLTPGDSIPGSHP